MPVALLALASLAWSGEKIPPRRGGAGADEPTRVLASVGKHWITQADVDLSLGRTGVAKADLPPIPEHVLMAAVDIIASQRQALATLRKSNQSVSEAEVDQWLVENSPPDLQLTAAQALAARAEGAHVTPENYREFLAFRLSWQKYLKDTATDQNLEKHFKNQQARFDGTRFQIEHLYIPVPPGASEARTAAHSRLDAIRQKILDGALDFPTAAQEIGGQELQKLAAPQWITGAGPLMPAIVDRVLATPKGQISPSFDSSQAVHLVRVLAVEPGQRTLEEAREEVRQHMLLFLLEYLAKPAAQDLPLVWR